MKSVQARGRAKVWLDCSYCDGRITPGDSVIRYDSIDPSEPHGHLKWAHLGCAEKSLREDVLRWVRESAPYLYFDHRVIDGEESEAFWEHAIAQYAADAWWPHCVICHRTIQHEGAAVLTDIEKGGLAHADCAGEAGAYVLGGELTKDELLRLGQRWRALTRGNMNLGPR